nr:MAG TPA: terminase large subunit [Caudoviricetes sp.]
MGRRITFDTKGNDRQKEVARLWIDPVVLEILYGGSKGSGKSFLGCSLLTGDALMYPGTHYFIARKTLADLVRYTIPSLYEVFEIYGIDGRYYRFNGQYNYFEFHNGSRIYLLDAKYMPTDPLYERFGSMQFTRGWIEEGGEFSRDAKANLQASLGRWKNDKYNLSPKLLITCNPSNNFLYTDYYKPWKDGKLPEWRVFVRALPQDNRMLPAGYVENLMRILTPSQIERLVHGNWEYDDDPNWLVDYDAICDIFTNEFVPDEGNGYISTDLAGKGRDNWVVGTWKGYCCHIPIVQDFSEGKEIEDRLRRLATELNIPHSRIVSDADGLGFYLESYLKGIKEFHGGARAVDTATYANLKSECAFKLAELINKRQVRVICSPEIEEKLKRQFGVLKSKNTNAAEQKRAVLSKDDMKALLGGESPDLLDMLIMRMIFEIHPKAEGMRSAAIIRPRKR